MKKSFIVLLLASLLISLVSIPVQAAEIDSAVSAPASAATNLPDESAATQGYTEVKLPAGQSLLDALYIVSSNAYLTIDFTELAACRTAVNCSSSVDKIMIYMYLEYSNGGTWGTLTSWNSTTYSNSVTMIRSTYVLPGTSYRTRSSIYAYVGTTFEHVTEYSSIVYN